MFEESGSEFCTDSSEGEIIKIKSKTKKIVTEFKFAFDKRELAKKALFNIAQGSCFGIKLGHNQGNRQWKSVVIIKKMEGKI